MNPTLVQALQRLVVIAAVGALSAVGLNLTVLGGALGANALLLVPILTAVIDAALKYLGGPTVVVTPAVVANGTTAALAAGPAFWAA